MHVNGGNEIQGYMWVRRGTGVHVGGGNETEGYGTCNGGNEMQLYMWMEEMRYKRTCVWGT